MGETYIGGTGTALLGLSNNIFTTMSVAAIAIIGKGIEKINEFKMTVAIISIFIFRVVIMRLAIAESMYCIIKTRNPSIMKIGIDFLAVICIISRLLTISFKGFASSKVAIWGIKINNSKKKIPGSMNNIKPAAINI